MKIVLKSYLAKLLQLLLSVFAKTEIVLMFSEFQIMHLKKNLRGYYRSFRKASYNCVLR